MTETLTSETTKLLRLSAHYPREAKELMLAAFFTSGFTSLQEEAEDCIVYYPEDKEEAERICAEIVAFLKTVNAPFSPEFSIDVLDDIDWVNRWKEFAVPVEIGGKLIVCSNDVAIDAPEGVEIIRLDPQLAFGTGSHPTTRMCLEMMLERFSERSFSSFLDIGCGSGILSITAARLGNASTLGLDIDPEAVRISAENAGRNGVPECKFTESPLGGIPGTFDLVCINIISSVITELWPEVLRHLAPGGELLVSGLLTEEKQSFLSFVNQLPAEVRENNGWLALRFTDSVL